MYTTLYGIHSHTRWLVLVSILATVVIYFLNGKSLRQSKLPALVALICTDFQLLIGTLLYFRYSPFGIKAFEQGMSVVMKTSSMRKIAIEHFLIMLISILFIHLGYSIIKKQDESKGKKAIIFYMIALVLMLAGIPWIR